MVNERISKSPLVLFLGAGASAPLGKPLMDGFVRGLQGKPPFEADPLFRAMVEKRADLEFLLEELEEWKSKDYYVARSVAKNIFGTIGKPEAPGSCDDWFYTLVRSARLLQRALKREVFDQYRGIASVDGAVKILQPLFGVLAGSQQSRHGPLVVFTTNYDPAVETLCRTRGEELNLFDGFVPQPYGGGYTWRREAIDNFDPGAYAEPGIVLFKLHGSTDWFKKAGGFVKSPVATYLEDDPTYENLLIYPAQRKIAIEDPYATAYEYFQRTLENARLCIVIGYSFRDYDALSRLRIASSYNPTLRLVVIDPNARALCLRLRAIGVHADPVPDNFGNPTATYLDRIREELERMPAG